MRQFKIESLIIGCSGNDIDDISLSAGVEWVWKRPMPNNNRIPSNLHGALQEENFTATSEKNNTDIP
jgi:hypothetical protein